MQIIQAILMGFVQGLSEFLPISSSAHLVFTSNLYKVITNFPTANHSGQEIFFDIMVHLGTLVAVVIYFRQDILRIINEFYNALLKNNWNNHDAMLGQYILIGTFVSTMVAYPLSKISENLVSKPEIVGILLILTAFVLFLSEYLSKRRQNCYKPLGYVACIIIGIAQGLAAIPGFSRSGWTIAAGLLSGLNRNTAARYSFLLSIPIILGASMVYPAVKLDFKEILGYNWFPIAVGTIVSGVVGFFCIKYFMKFISKFSMNVFAWYCLIVGIFSAIFFTIN